MAVQQGHCDGETRWTTEFLPAAPGHQNEVRVTDPVARQVGASNRYFISSPLASQSSGREEHHYREACMWPICHTLSLDQTL